MWREARDKRLAQVPGDPIDEVLWLAIQAAMAEQRARKQEPKAGSQEPVGPASPRVSSPEARVANSESQIPGPERQTTNPQSGTPNPEPRIANSAEELDDLHLQWRVERLLAVFLCSETYPAFQAAERENHRVEEAFGALERELDAVLPPLEKQ